MHNFRLPLTTLPGMILKTTWYVHYTFGVWIRRPDVWSQNKCRSLWPYISWSSDCALYLEDLFHVWTSFMVHWFSLISQIQFDGWVSYFQIMRQCDTNFDPQNIHIRAPPGTCSSFFSLTGVMSLGKNLNEICQQDILKSIWARCLKLGQLIGDDE